MNYILSFNRNCENHDIWFFCLWDHFSSISFNLSDLILLSQHGGRHLALPSIQLVGDTVAWLFAKLQLSNNWPHMWLKYFGMNRWLSDYRMSRCCSSTLAPNIPLHSLMCGVRCVIGLFTDKLRHHCGAVCTQNTVREVLLFEQKQPSQAFMFPLKRRGFLWETLQNSLRFSLWENQRNPEKIRKWKRCIKNKIWIKSREEKGELPGEYWMKGRSQMDGEESFLDDLNISKVLASKAVN